MQTTLDGDGPAGEFDLRGAIDMANILGGIETITFDPTVFATPQTITLTSGVLTLSDTTGTESITGPAAGVTIDANHASGVLTVDANVTASLSGLTIAGGNTSGYGGGLYDHGGMVTLTNCTVSGNSAVSGVGGGVAAVHGGTITLTDCSVSGNSALNGGGVEALGGAITLTNWTVSGNQGGIVGGLMVSDFFPFPDVLTLTDCTVSGNTGGDGSGLFAEGGTVTLTNSTFSGNSAYEGAACSTRTGPRPR